MEVSGAKPIGDQIGRGSWKKKKKDRVRVKRKTLESLLDQCQKAIETLGEQPKDNEDELCNLIKSRVENPDFIEELKMAQVSVPQTMAAESSSWDMISENDLWESGNIQLEEEDYVLVRQEDIAEGIACFMAAYLLSLKQTKDLTPTQLQDALSKTFSLKKRKGKLRKAWDGTQVISNVASWGATAIGIYQNPALLGAASAAFWTSCSMLSKLL